MKAALLKSFGSPDAFEISDVPKPVPEAGEVLVRVHATSINPLDYQVRRGDYADYVPLPAITGHDISGEGLSRHLEARAYRAVLVHHPV